MSEREFHIGDVLSVTTGRLLSPRHMDGIYDILNFLTGDSLFTHQLPRAMERCRPFVLDQLPELREVTGDDVTRENHAAWLADITAQFGEQKLLHSIESFVEHREPISELVEMVGPEKVLIVQPKQEPTR